MFKLKLIPEVILNYFCPKIMKARYNYSDSLLIIEYSNNKKRIFQGSGVVWKEVPKMKFVSALTAEELFKIKKQIDQTGKEYVAS